MQLDQNFLVTLAYQRTAPLERKRYFQCSINQVHAPGTEQVVSGELFPGLAQSEIAKALLISMGTLCEIIP